MRNPFPYPPNHILTERNPTDLDLFSSSLRTNSHTTRSNLDGHADLNPFPYPPNHILTERIPTDLDPFPSSLRTNSHRTRSDRSRSVSIPCIQ